MHGAFAFHCTQTSPLDQGLSKQLNTKAHQSAACPALPGHTGQPASLTPSAPAPWPSLRLLVILSAVPPQNLGACPARPDTLLASVLGCCFSSLRSYLSHLLGEASQDNDLCRSCPALPTLLHFPTYFPRSTCHPRTLLLVFIISFSSPGHRL